MVLLLVSMSLHSPVRAGVDSFTWLSLFLAALFLSPFLCVFRAGLIMQGDHSQTLAAAGLPKDALVGAYQNFQQRTFCRNLLEGMALVFAAACGFFFVWDTFFVGLFIIVALCLMLDSVPRLSQSCDFTSLRARYQQELARQGQLRRFLHWLWFAPVLVALHDRLVLGESIAALLNCVAAAILCFLVMALNREHGGRVQEQIGVLDRMRETSPPSPLP
jgi:hypothetical protein